jgi:hypothetical protein
LVDFSPRGTLVLFLDAGLKCETGRPACAAPSIAAHMS